MTFWLSRPFEALLAGGDDAVNPPAFDTLIIGSGYGAAMAALALTEDNIAQPGEIAVLERGDEFLPQDMPRSLGDVASNVRFTNASNGAVAPAAVSDDTALWDVRSGDGIVSISGNGLGGTSLVNASVVVPPLDGVLDTWPQPDGAPWAKRFAACQTKIEALLGAVPYPADIPIRKFDALARTASAFGARTERPPLSINVDGPGPHSVDHGPCNACGNCVIGCHSGAKQSLNLNAWPLAHQRGVSLHTGARVLSLQESEEGWQVHGTLSRDASTTFVIAARRVVLCAGAIGSTEILMRSRSLQLSPRLGKSFSTNGDGLHLSIGQRSPVNAMAGTPDIGATSRPGPTIVGRAVTDGAEGAGRLTLEDGAIPHPIVGLFSELTTSLEFLRRFVASEPTAWQKDNPDNDQLVSDDALAEHTQVLLSMGFDGNQGTLRADGAGGQVLPYWPHDSGKHGFYSRLHAAFTSLKQRAFDGLDGGRYQANPVRKPLPDDFVDIFEGADALEGSVTTVHPLGGCNMGSSAATGVVNTYGQVFHSAPAQLDSTDVYENLYVLDGAAVPGAVGTNPMLTISSLAYCLGSRMAGRDMPTSAPFALLEPRFKKLPDIPEPPAITASPVVADFSERLFWKLDTDAATREQQRLALQRLIGKPVNKDVQALALDICFEFSGTTSLDRWKNDPGRELPARAELYELTDPLLHTSADVEFPNEALMHLQGGVTLGKEDRASGLRSWARMLSAGVRYVRYRPFAVGAALLGLLRRRPSESTTSSSSGGFLKRAAGYVRVARLHSDYRHLVYRLEHEDLLLEGRKSLEFRARGETVWNTLFQLPMHWRRSGVVSMHTEFSIDLIGITKGPAPLQIRQAEDTPHALVAIVRSMSLMARMLLQTHFWSFGAHDYERMQDLDGFDRERMNLPPDRLCYIREGVEHSSEPVTTYTSPDELTRLIQYRPAGLVNTEVPALLLVHGLAHSSEIFWTDLLSENYAQYFLANGFQVWIVDHRTSANSRLSVDPAHTWDDIALIDLPWAVRKVFDVINSGASTGLARQVHVFSHCIGAGAVSIAALAGKLQQPDAPQRSMLASLVPHAVTPWLYASADNRARENGWALVKDLELIDTVEPRLHSRPHWTEIIFDRLATSTIDRKERVEWPWSKHWRDSRGGGFARSVYVRYTIFWGQQWNHRNVSRRLKRAFAGMIGPVPIAVLQQVYFSVTRNRLVAHEGSSEYVNEQALAKYFTFPTLFLHGDVNRVFDIESSRLSAELLMRFRRADSGDALPGDDTPEHARHGVWLETFADYGHMDMIFGKHATRSAGPALLHFFKAAEAEASAGREHDRFTTFATRYADRRIKPEDRPHTRLDPSLTPLCGPVLSLDNDTDLLVWNETDDYSTHLPEAIELNAGTQDGALRVVPSESLTRPYPVSPRGGRFWLNRITHPTLLPCLPQARVVHAAQPDLSTAANSSLTPTGDLPWWRRRFGEGPHDGEPDLCLGLGSCLHPGSTFERELSDTIFEGIDRHIFANAHSGEDAGIDMLLLLGDQIYADATADLADPIALYERFRGRYRTAFRGSAMRRVMSRVPTRFVADDHALYDDYAGLAVNADCSARELFEVARREAANFQSHRHVGMGARIDETPRLWGEVRCRGHRLFCLDTRFERQDIDRAQATALLGGSQLDAFCDWLQATKDDETVLFVASGSAFMPVSRDLVAHPSLQQHVDGLLAYSGFLETLFDAIVQLPAVTRVVWLSGDPHLSCHAHIELERSGRSVQMHQVVASGLFAPLPFANVAAQSIDWGRTVTVPIRGSDVTLTLQQHLLSDANQQFTRLDLDSMNARMTLGSYDASGALLHRSGATVDLLGVLPA